MKRNLKINKYIYLFIVSFIGIAYYCFFEPSNMFLVVLYCFVLLPFIFIKAKRDIFDLGLMFLAIYSIYTLCIPIKSINENIEHNAMFYLFNFNSMVYKMTFICCFCAIVFFVIGYEIPLKPRGKILNDQHKSTKTSERYITIFTSVLIIFGIGLYFYGIHLMGGISYLLHMYIWNNNNQLGLGILTTGYQLFSLGILIEFYRYLMKIKDSNEKFNIFKWKYIYLLFIILLIKFYQGNRLSVIMFCMSMVVLYNYLYKKIPLKKAIIFVLVCITIFGYAGYFRTSKKIVPENITEIPRYIYVVSMNNETFFNSYSALATTYVTSYYDVDYLYGKTLLDGGIYFLPRFIFENKDELLFTTDWIEKNNKYASISPVGGLNLAAQNIMNGGVYFTALFMLALGLLLGYLNRLKDSSHLGVLIYALSFPILTLSLVRNPNFLVFKEYITFALIPFLILIFLYSDTFNKFANKIKIGNKGD